MRKQIDLPGYVFNLADDIIFIQNRVVTCQYPDFVARFAYSLNSAVLTSPRFKPAQNLDNMSSPIYLDSIGYRSKDS